MAQTLEVSQAKVNAGRTGFQQPITATFELRNKGRRRLLIESVKPDCGCTAVEYPKEVAAGEKFTIKMTYDAKMLGHFQKMAAVVSNGSQKPVYLMMRGLVVPEVLDYTGNYPLALGNMLYDNNVLEFDDVNKGDTPMQEIHVMNNGEEPMQPHLMHLPPYLSATMKPEILEPGKGGTLSVTLNSDKLRDFGLTQTSVYLGRRLGEKVSKAARFPSLWCCCPICRITTSSARASPRNSRSRLRTSILPTSAARRKRPLTWCFTIRVRPR